MNWNFNATDYEENSFAPLPVGDYRVRIKEANEKKSSKGNDMIEIVFEVSGKASKLWYYIVMMPDNAKMTNQKLGQMFESFGITQGDLDLSHWIGKVGGVRIKHEPSKDGSDVKAAVHYPLNKKQQEKLPAWTEPPVSGTSENNSPAPANYYPAPSDNEAPPFNPDDLL